MKMTVSWRFDVILREFHVLKTCPLCAVFEPEIHEFMFYHVLMLFWLI